MYILFAVILFCVLILVHELGHFLAAKRCGVRVNEFSIFMGPKILQIQGRETVYSLRCIPFGGYCAMEGEDNASDSPSAFTSQSWLRRAVILAAGPLMNYLVGFLAVLALNTTSSAFLVPVIASFEETCPLAEVLETGDTILSVDGERVYLASDISTLLGRGDTVHDIVVLRDGKKQTLYHITMEKRLYTQQDGTSYRYGFNLTVEPKSAAVCLTNAWYSTLDFARMVQWGIGDILSGQVGLEDMSGPVGIVEEISQTGEQSENAREGLENGIYFGAFLAVNLAFVNLLPLPALDGGRIFTLTVTELIRCIIGKKPNPKYEGFIHAAGLALLLAFMAVVTMSDIRQLLC